MIFPETLKETAAENFKINEKMLEKFPKNYQKTSVTNFWKGIPMKSLKMAMFIPEAKYFPNYLPKFFYRMCHRIFWRNYKTSSDCVFEVTRNGDWKSPKVLLKKNQLGKGSYYPRNEEFVVSPYRNSAHNYILYRT